MEEELRRLLDELKHTNKLVIVEGNKDKAALAHLGITNVMTLKRPLYAVVEEIARIATEVVLLTDLDDTGKELYHTLSRDLQRHGIAIDNKLREALFRTPLRHIEGLDTYLTGR